MVMPHKMMHLGKQNRKKNEKEDTGLVLSGKKIPKNTVELGFLVDYLN